jgi:hypothetical protein
MKNKLIYSIFFLAVLNFTLIFGIYSNNQQVSQLNQIMPLNNWDPDVNRQFSTQGNILEAFSDAISVDYLGVYSFTTDTDDTVPQGWTRPYYATNTDGKVISEKAGHRNVIALYDNNPDTHGNGYTVLLNTFSAQTTGTMEWWFYGNKTGSECSHQVNINNGASNGIYLYYNISGALFAYVTGSVNKICDLTNEMWHHFRLQFDCGSDTFNIWVDGVLKGTGLGFQNPQISLNCINLYTGGGSTGGFWVYFDAFDYSWAPGYYLNRNTNFCPSIDELIPSFDLILVIFALVAFSIAFGVKRSLKKLDLI